MTLESKILNSGYKHIAVSCIIEYRGKLLLLERNNNPHKGLYCPIGGKMEPYESPKEAIIREVKEETGLTIDVFRMAGIMIETSPSEHNWISIIYNSILKNEFTVSQTSEGSLQWVPWSRLPNIPLPDTDIHIYNYVKNDHQFILDVTYDSNGNINSIENELTLDNRIGLEP